MLLLKVNIEGLELVHLLRGERISSLICYRSSRPAPFAPFIDKRRDGGAYPNHAGVHPCQEARLAEAHQANAEPVNIMLKEY